MKQKARVFGKIAIFLIILAILIRLLEIPFSPAYWFPLNRLQDRTGRIGAITLEKENTIDIVCMGDSLSVMGFSPMDLWKEYGFTSYNFGSDGLRMGEAYYHAKLFDRYQNPKVLLLETGLFFRYNMMEELQTIVAQEIYYHFSGLRYHNLWKQPFELEGVRRYYKGYLINETCTPYEDGYCMDQKFHWTMLMEIKPIIREHFDMLKEYCDKHDITLILYSAPSAANYNHDRCKLLSDCAEENGLAYFNLNEDIPELGIDWSTDTTDGGDHMNLFGARKVTRYLAEYIKSENLAEDHRGDPDYADWDVQAKAFDKLVAEMKGTYFGNIEEERDRALREERERRREERKQR